jgi:hypothetical protein
LDVVPFSGVFFWAWSSLALNAPLRGQNSELRTIELLGEATIAGTALDKAGLTDAMEDSTPHNQFGGVSTNIKSTTFLAIDEERCGALEQDGKFGAESNCKVARSLKSRKEKPNQFLTSCQLKGCGERTGIVLLLKFFNIFNFFVVVSVCFRSIIDTVSNMTACQKRAPPWFAAKKSKFKNGKPGF